MFSAIIAGDTASYIFVADIDALYFNAAGYQSFLKFLQSSVGAIRADAGFRLLSILSWGFICDDLMSYAF